jgi:hypothetical protein
MVKKLFTAAAFITSLTSMSSVQATLIVDNFIDATSSNGYQQVIGYNNNTIYSSTNTGLTGVLGGERLLEVFNVQNGVQDFEEAKLQVNSNKGQINFSNEADVTSTSRVSWNGLGQGGIGGVDITENNFNEMFIIDVASADSGMSMLFTVEDMSGNTATQVLTAGGLGLFKFFFVDFTNFATTNFAEVNFLSLEFSGPIGSDMSVSYIEADELAFVSVPEPASILMLGLSLICLRRVLN